MDLAEKIANDLAVRTQQISATISLLDDGATVPFIARYRKEATGGLDDSQLRRLEERLGYLRELQQRCKAIVKSIQEQGKLTVELETALRIAPTKTILEDLYLPFKPKRRSKAQTARESGLEPLADCLLKERRLPPAEYASQYINSEKGIPDCEAALNGARDILIETFYENADLLQEFRETLWQKTVLTSQVIKSKIGVGNKFRDYFEYFEATHKIPSHRAMALFRGESEKILRLNISIPENSTLCHRSCAQKIAQSYSIKAHDKWLIDTVNQAWQNKIFPRLEQDLKKRLKQMAEQDAIAVFGGNLKDLLLAAPAGARTTMGLDPGIRTGVKVAVIDQTGALLDTETIYPHPPRKEWDKSIHRLAQLMEKFHVDLISIGNGTGSRETDQLVEELKQRYPETKLDKVITSEAGASVYSASQFAANEFPELDVTLRGAVSIARRLQDPLAELVKIEARAIGVGQYQHDVNQNKLGQALEATVEDCVNAVGVNLNTASIPLLRQVSGISASVASNIVEFRNTHGRFNKRDELHKVPRLGKNTYQQAAGFLRIIDGDNPLDGSAVHPEAYSLIHSILKRNGKNIEQLIGNPTLLKSLNAEDYTNESFGLPTVNDILVELEKPGRDPRPEFQTLTFDAAIKEIADLKPGIKLKGIVTNVTNFGAFVDIGVHQDGLVHISQLSDTFVKDPKTIVKVGETVSIQVLEVDIDRRRISLSMKSGSQPVRAKVARQTTTKADHRHSKSTQPKPESAISAALSKALKK